MSLEGWFALGILWIIVTGIGSFILTNVHHVRSPMRLNWKTVDREGKPEYGFFAWWTFFWSISFLLGCGVVSAFHILHMFSEMFHWLDGRINTRDAG